nr:polyprotein 2 [Broad bean true mosaic virus]
MFDWLQRHKRLNEINFVRQLQDSGHHFVSFQHSPVKYFELISFSNLIEKILILQLVLLFILCDLCVGFLTSCVYFPVLTLCKMTTEIIQQGIPAQLLEEKAAAFKRAKVANKPLKDIIPSSSQLYEKNFSFFERLKMCSNKRVLNLMELPAGSCAKYAHMKVEKLRALPVQTIDLPLVPREQVVGAENIYRSSNLGASAAATAMHVGAMEVIINSFASPSSDLMTAMMLVDTAHKRPENAIRSIFIAPMCGGKPVRVVVFPNTLVPLNADMNSRFKLVCSMPNCDFAEGAPIADISLNLVGCVTGLERSYVPTPLLVEEYNKERGVIVDYLGKNTHALHLSNDVTPEQIGAMTFEFSHEGPSELGVDVNGNCTFKRGEKLSYTIGGSSSGIRRALESSTERHLDPRDDAVCHTFAQTSTDLFRLSLNDTKEPEGSLLNTRFAQIKVRIPKSMEGGVVLANKDFGSLIPVSNFRAYSSLARTHRIEGEILCISTINLPETTGCCLAICINSVSSGNSSTDIFNTGAQERVLWNPACSKNNVFSFNPNPCSTAWSLEFLKRTKLRVTVQCVSGWTTVPQTDLQMTMDWYVSNKPCVPRTYMCAGGMQDVVMNRWMGKLVFPQGIDLGLIRMPLAIGGGAGAEKAILMNMPNAFISLWRYYRGEFVFEVNKMSSPFIKSTICFFIGFGDLDETVTNLEDFPNKLVQFGEIAEKKELIFSHDEFLTAWSTQVDPNKAIANDGCPYLYALVHDATSSTIAGDFILGVTLKTIKNFVGMGQNPGIQGARLLGAKAQGPFSGVDQRFYSPVYKIRTPLNGVKGPGASFSCDLLNGDVVTDVNKDWVIQRFNSPVANLLKTAAWKKGTLHVKVSMLGSGTKHADWQNVTQVILKNSLNTNSYAANTWSIAEPGAFMFHFPLNIVGPNNGFEMRSSDWASQTSWFLSFVISNPEQCVFYEIDMAFGEDFEVAGNNMMPPFDLDTSNTRSHSAIVRMLNKTSQPVELATAPQVSRTLRDLPQSMSK